MTILLSLAILVSVIPGASALSTQHQDSVSYNINGERVTVQALSTNELLVTEGSEKSLITFSEKNNVVTTAIKNISSGGEAVFIRDYNAGTLYSSITGYTGAVQASITEPGTYRISYKELLAYVSISAGATEIVAGICAIAGLTAAAPVVGIVGGILAIISGGLALQDENSGMEYTVDYVTIHKSQGGRDFYIDVLRIVGVGTY